MGSTLMAALGTGVSVVVAIVFVFAIGSIVDLVAVPVINLFINLSVEPLSIPLVNQAILWAQLGALAVAIAIRVGKGIYEIVLHPYGGQVSLAEWITKSILTIALVGIMPVFCSMIINVGTMMFTDIQGAVVSTGHVTIQSNPLVEEFINGLANGSFTQVMGAFANSFLVCLVVAAAIMVVYQMFKREVIMLVVSVAATWVSVKAASESYDDYVDVLVSLFALCLTQWIQYLFFAVAIVMVNNFIGGVSWMEVDIAADGAIQSYILVLAFLGGAMAVPSILERYAFNSGRSGVGNLVVGMAVRGGISSVGNAARGVGNLVKSSRG